MQAAALAVLEYLDEQDRIERRESAERLEALLVGIGFLANDPSLDPFAVLGHFLPDEVVEEGDASGDSDDTVFDTSNLTYELPSGGAGAMEAEAQLIEAMLRNKQVEIQGD